MTVTASCANLAIGISLLSISATIAAANASETANASNLAAKIVPLALTSPNAPDNAVTVPKGVVNPLPLITAAACIPADAVTSPVTSIPPALTFTTSALLASKWISFAVSKSIAV